MVLRGYIDESYNARVFTLSCLMTTPYEWMWFESAWKKVLRKKNTELRDAGRPKISRYHAADCSSLKGEFLGCTVEEQIQFVKSLLVVFRSRFTNSVAYSIYVEDWQAVFPEHEMNLMENMYGTLVKFLMVEMNAQVRDAMERQRCKPVAFALLHDRSQFNAVVSRSFNQMLRDKGFSDKHRFSSITPVGWEECIPLQAADLVAYEIFKDSENQLSGRKRRKSFNALLEGAGFAGRAKLFDRSSVADLRERLRSLGVLSAC